MQHLSVKIFAQPAAEFRDPTDELIVDAPLHEETGSGTADLAGIGENRHAGARYSGLEIRIGVIESKRNPSASNYRRYKRVVALVDQVLVPLSATHPILDVWVK